MQLKDLSKSDFTFEIEDKKLRFKIITWKDALEAHNAIHLMATNIPANVDESNKRMFTLALKHVIINDEIESPTGEIWATQFNNPFACTELSAKFREYIMGFLERLPSFQQVQLTQG